MRQLLPRRDRILIDDVEIVVFWLRSCLTGAGMSTAIVSRARTIRFAGRPRRQCDLPS